jgi:hypothetical protein
MATWLHGLRATLILNNAKILRFIKSIVHAIRASKPEGLKAPRPYGYMALGPEGLKAIGLHGHDRGRNYFWRGLWKLMLRPEIPR